MKTSLVIAALAAALITGSTVGSQALPAAPLNKSIQQNSASLVERDLDELMRACGVPDLCLQSSVVDRRVNSICYQA